MTVVVTPVRRYAKAHAFQIKTDTFNAFIKWSAAHRALCVMTAAVLAFVALFIADYTTFDMRGAAAFWTF